MFLLACLLGEVAWGFWISRQNLYFFWLFVGIIGNSSFLLALSVITFCLFFAGFHNSACIINPQDLAPKHSGSVFGIMNAAGAIPGTLNSNSCFDKISGYVSSFPMALMLCTLALFSKSFHNFGTVVNAIDIAPKHSGSIFGAVNTFGSSSG